MKAVTVSTPTAPVDASKGSATAATQGQGDSTDFLALFMQAISTNTQPTGDVSSGLLNAGVDLQADQDDGTSDSDETDVAALMATLAGANVIPPAPIVSEIKLDSMGARGIDLTGAVMNAMAKQAGEVVAGALGAQDDATASLADAQTDASNLTVDPRLSQNAVDNVRDVRSSAQPEIPVQRQMHATVGTRAWTEELGGQINLMTDRNQQTASLRLSPEHLGPLEIQISIQDDKASVWFGAAHADTRAAIENALPRLREMMASSGLSLNDAGVFKEAPRQQTQYKPDRIDGVEASAADEVKSVRIGRLGLVDAYA